MRREMGHSSPRPQAVASRRVPSPLGQRFLGPQWSARGTTVPCPPYQLSLTARSALHAVFQQKSRPPQGSMLAREADLLGDGGRIVSERKRREKCSPQNDCARAVE